jgi:hypothetical protein
MTTHDGRGRELDARLGQANEQIDRLREATDRSGNVVQFRMARSLESLHELVVDLNERSRQMPPADTYERRTAHLPADDPIAEAVRGAAVVTTSSWKRSEARRPSRVEVVSPSRRATAAGNKGANAGKQAILRGGQATAGEVAEPKRHRRFPGQWKAPRLFECTRPSRGAGMRAA